ncbi:MAG TPA: YqiA/YcfP family alpha/beta fold hydrolase [Burkholderiales bacterium]|nr:YqiA/YcfP family alpha/beta fold hydrolase [Burkholderiales bacterium]
MLIYIHGFNSSPASAKAQLLKTRLDALGRGEAFAAPALPHSPAQAAALLDDFATRHPGAALVGSSLGGYYATWLAERHGLQAVLLNPAVRPYELLKDHTGWQENFHTGERYEFTARHVDELRVLEVSAITPARYLLIAATADEVLDYRRAVERYDGCRRIVVQGGDHGLSDFADHAGAVLAFCGLTG